MHTKTPPQQAFHREETRQFWAICSEIAALQRAHPDTRQTDEAVLVLLDELEGICLHTEQPGLRSRISMVLASYHNSEPEQAAAWLSQPASEDVVTRLASAWPSKSN